jgi:hypothetical protein
LLRRGAQLALRERGERVLFGGVVLHRDDFAVAEAHDRCGLNWPFESADLARVGYDDDGVLAAVSRLECPCGSPLRMTFAKRLEDPPAVTIEGGIVRGCPPPSQLLPRECS